MIRLAIICLILALVAAALGFGGIAGVAVNFAYILGAVALILFIVGAVSGKRV
ncbi:MAG: DUF1328 family protein [Verrucomicrobiota bacterium JB023]|nr:DUF1328 family protein [Verrucomicrobiota bacterium JB023]